MARLHGETWLLWGGTVEETKREGEGEERCVGAWSWGFEGSGHEGICGKDKRCFLERNQDLKVTWQRRKTNRYGICIMNNGTNGDSECANQRCTTAMTILK